MEGLTIQMMNSEIPSVISFVKCAKRINAKMGRTDNVDNVMEIAFALTGFICARPLSEFELVETTDIAARSAIASHEELSKRAGRSIEESVALIAKLEAQAKELYAASRANEDACRRSTAKYQQLLAAAEDPSSRTTPRLKPSPFGDWA